MLTIDLNRLHHLEQQSLQASIEHTALSEACREAGQTLQDVRRRLANFEEALAHDRRPITTNATRSEYFHGAGANPPPQPVGISPDGEARIERHRRSLEEELRAAERRHNALQDKFQEASRRSAPLKILLDRCKSYCRENGISLEG